MLSTVDDREHLFGKPLFLDFVFSLRETRIVACARVLDAETGEAVCD